MVAVCTLLHKWAWLRYSWVKFSCTGFKPRNPRKYCPSKITRYMVYPHACCHTHTHSPQVLRVHTEPLLITLATPDFSMPYNVICFVCTVVAIGFGSIFNLTTRKLVPDTGDTKSRLSRLLSWFRRDDKKEKEDVVKDVSGVEGIADQKTNTQ